MQQADILNTSGLRLFERSYPAYFAACVKFGARIARRPVAFFDTFLETGKIEHLHRSVGSKVLAAAEVNDLLPYHEVFNSFIYGFSGIPTLFLNAQRRDNFLQTFKD